MLVELLDQSRGVAPGTYAKVCAVVLVGVARPVRGGLHLACMPRYGHLCMGGFGAFWRWRYGRVHRPVWVGCAEGRPRHWGLGGGL